MAEPSITTPDERDYNTSGLSLTDPEKLVVDNAPQGMDADSASRKAFAFSDLTSATALPSAQEDTQDRIRTTLMFMGKSPEVDTMEQEITTYRQNEFGLSLVDQINESMFGVSDAPGMIQEAQRAGTVSVEDELLIRAGENADMDQRLLSDEPNSLINFDYSEWVKTQNTERDELVAANSDIVAGMDPAFASLYGDLLAEAGVPLALSSSAAQFASTVEELKGSSVLDRILAGIEGFFLPGESRDRARKWIQSLDPEIRPQMARELAIAFRDKSGVIFDNDVQTIDWIETVINTSLDDRVQGGTDWDRVLYNLITVIDLIPFLRKTVIGTGRLIKGYVGQLARINRMKAKDIIGKVYENPNSLRGTVAPPEELATGQLPKTTLKDVDAQPSIANSDVVGQLDNQATIVRGAENTAINYTAEEMTGFAQRLQSAYQGVKGGWLKMNGFTIDASEGDRLVIDAMYTRTKGEGGWLSPKSALNAAEKLTDGVMDGVRLVVKEADGSLTPFLTGKELRARFRNELATPDGEEYFLQVRRTHFPSQIDRMAFGDTPVFFTAGGAGRYLGDATQQFSREIWEPAYVALGRGQIFEREVINLAQPFWALSTGSRRRITSLIESGSTQKKTFTPQELIGEFKSLTSKDITIGEMKAYYSFRNANDAAWAVANRSVYKEMNGQGYHTLTSISHRSPWLARPLRTGDGEVNRAYDPKSRRIIDVTPALVAKMEKKGGGIQVLHQNDDIVRGHESTRFIIRDGTRETQLTALPLNPLRYEEGYVARIYKDNFFVVRKDATRINGQTVDANGEQITRNEVAVTARTALEAEAIAVRLTEETGVPHSVKDLKADSNYSKVVNDTMLLEQDRMVFASREEKPLVRADGTLTPAADPVESLHRVATAVARTIGIEDYVKIQEQKFIATFADIIKPDVWRKYIRNEFGPSAVATDLRNSADPRAAEALQLWQYYQMLRGTESPISQRAWRAFVNGVAEGAEMLARSPTVGEFISRGAERTPTEFAKGMVFATLIAANPIRQWALQSMQFTFLAGANPRIAAASARDLTLLKTGLAMIDTPNWEEWAAKQASRGHWTTAEIGTLVREFKTSGLVAEIDSYSYIGSQIAEKNLSHTTNALTGAAQIAKNTINAPLRAAKQAGFVSGESNNLALTYSFAVRDYLSKTGKNIADLSPREFQQIGAQASAYALGMHKAGTLAYQQGIPSMLTQFWSIQHKAVAAMLPATIGGSRAFTGQQKIGIAAFQLGFYGAAGWGVEDIVRKMMVETRALEGVDDETANHVTRIVSTGIMELTLNSILSELSGETVDASFGSSFAPAGAPVSTVTDFFLSMMTLGIEDGIMRETALGSTIGKYTQIGRYINHTWGMDAPLPNTPTQLERTLLVVPTVLSGVSNGLQGFYALRMGQMMTQFGDHRIQVSWPEAILKATVGVTTNQAEDYRRLTEMSGKGFYFKQSDAEEMASLIWKTQVKNLLFFEEMGDYSITRAMAQVEGERALMGMLQGAEKEMVREAYLKLVNDRRGSPEDIFAILLRFVDTNAVTPEKMIEAVRTNMLMGKYPEQAEQMVILLERMVEGRNERMDFYEEQNLQFDDELNFLLDVED